jgi:NAD(P)-dependent dehydrogenase (short-subunit alcohol dehydrogenase family)
VACTTFRRKAPHRDDAWTGPGTGDNVTVNTIAPGFTLTEASRTVVDNAETWGVDRGAIRRAEQPEDLAGTVLWLASPHSDFVTGRTLIVDGGRQFR